MTIYEEAIVDEVSFVKASIDAMMFAVELFIKKSSDIVKVQKSKQILASLKKLKDYFKKLEDFYR